MKIIVPPCPRCDEIMNKTDDSYVCSKCGEEQSFSCAVRKKKLMQTLMERIPYIGPVTFTTEWKKDTHE